MALANKKITILLYTTIYHSNNSCKASDKDLSLHFDLLNNITIITNLAIIQKYKGKSIHARSYYKIWLNKHQ